MRLRPFEIRKNSSRSRDRRNPAFKALLQQLIQTSTGSLLYPFNDVGRSSLKNKQNDDIKTTRQRLTLLSHFSSKRWVITPVLLDILVRAMSQDGVQRRCLCHGQGRTVLPPASWLVWPLSCSKWRSFCFISNNSQFKFMSWSIW